MSVDGHDGPVGGFQVFLGEATANKLRYVVFRYAAGHLFPDVLERLVHDLTQQIGAAAMPLQLARGPALGSVLHQVG